MPNFEFQFAIFHSKTDKDKHLKRHKNSMKMQNNNKI